MKKNVKRKKFKPRKPHNNIPFNEMSDLFDLYFPQKTSEAIPPPIRKKGKLIFEK